MRRVCRMLSRFRHDRSGTVAVEFALTGLIMLATFLSVIEIGRSLYQDNAMSYAADVAMRRIYLNAAVTTADLQTAARDTTSLGSHLALTSALSTVGAAKFRTITLNYPLKLFVPGIPHDAITMSVLRKVQVE